MPGCYADESCIPHNRSALLSRQVIFRFQTTSTDAEKQFRPITPTYKVADAPSGKTDGVGPWVMGCGKITPVNKCWSVYCWLHRPVIVEATRGMVQRNIPARQVISMNRSVSENGSVEHPTCCCNFPDSSGCPFLNLEYFPLLLSAVAEQDSVFRGPKPVIAGTSISEIGTAR